MGKINKQEKKQQNPVFFSIKKTMKKAELKIIRRPSPSVCV